jgi:hypothetical protein
MSPFGSISIGASDGATLCDRCSTSPACWPAKRYFLVPSSAAFVPTVGTVDGSTGIGGASSGRLGHVTDTDLSRYGTVGASICREGAGCGADKFFRCRLRYRQYADRRS